MVGLSISLPESFLLTYHSQGRDSFQWAARVLLMALKPFAQTKVRDVKSG